jgi:hypothetical protein
MLNTKTTNETKFLDNNEMILISKDGTSAKGYYKKAREQEHEQRIKKYSGIETLQDACREEGIDYIGFKKQRFDLQ